MRKYLIVGLASLVAAGVPGASGPALSASSRAASTAPAAVCVPGEGCASWRRADSWSRAPSVYTTAFHPVAAQPSVTAYAAWMRTSSTQLALYPGYKGPGDTALNRGPEQVPPTARGRLLATFNSGFYEFDRAGGFYVHHTLYFPMLRGLATLVRYANGKVDLETWRWGARPGGHILMARQNLPLLVANGAPTPLSANNAAWGVTLHGVPDVWRTALGIDAAGNLVYAAAPAQTSASLARIMVQLHCVRAMQLDINPEWPIFVTYAGPGARNPSLFVPNPNQIPGRFLYPSTKDFFALYAVSSPGGEQPW
jgi:Phosphodiester glycosidase